MTAARQNPGACAKELLLSWMRTRPAGVYQSSIMQLELERLIVLIDAHIAKAVAAERERCAKIAEAWQKANNRRYGDDIGENIAAAIRNTP
jgi:hypothetical protein